MKKLTTKQVAGLVLCMLLLAGQAFGSQRVEVAPSADISEHEQLIAKGLELAIAQEIQVILGRPLPAQRLEAVVKLLVAEQEALILGYSEVPQEANASTDIMVLDVHPDTGALRQRLQDMGILATAAEPQTYVLQLVDVEPSLTRGLGPLQEISGLQPVATGGPDLPVLKLQQEPPAAWKGQLSHGAWSLSRTTRTLDELWWSLWKEYFSQAGERLDSGVVVRVAGWLSSTGPMEFDRMLDSWTTEIERKALVGVEMAPTGMVGVWKIKALHEQSLTQRLDEAAKAQGLTLEFQ